jgi:hypothetical protein
MPLAIVVLALVLGAVVAVAYHRERRRDAIINDLLDRVMARSYGEYVSGTKTAATAHKPKRRLLTDEEMAEMERMKKDAYHDAGAALVRSGR